MKTSHKSKKNICKYRLEKYNNKFYKNKQNINPACACYIYLIIVLFCFIYLFFKLCIQRCQTTNLIHQSELRTYTKVVSFKEKSSFHLVVLWIILNGME